MPRIPWGKFPNLPVTPIPACIVTLLLIVAAGVVHGLWSDRWGQSQELEQATQRLARVPAQFGDWVSKEVEGDPRSFAQAGAQAYFIRSYTHSRTGASFLVILMCGRAGKMSVHTPEVCYRGAGFEVLDTPMAWPVKTETGDMLGEFWTSRFQKTDSGSGYLRLFWGWTAHGPWQAPREPRWTFQGEPYLYKLYITQEGYEAITPEEDVPAQEFLRRFLLELKDSLEL